MMACIGRNYSKIFVFDEVYYLFHFNIIIQHNRMYSTKIIQKFLLTPAKYQARNYYYYYYYSLTKGKPKYICLRIQLSFYKQFNLI